jgi:hypothetical protein
MSIDHVGWPSDHEDGFSVTRELRSGLTGLGGRPVLHPAWREAAEPRARMAATSSPRAWPAFSSSAPSIHEGRLAA